MTDSLTAKSIMKENLYIVMAGFGLLVVLAVFFYVAYQSMSVGDGSATSSQHNKVSDQITEAMAMSESRYRKAYLENAAHVLQDNRLTIIEYRYMQSNYHTLLEREDDELPTTCRGRGFLGNTHTYLRWSAIAVRQIY